MVNNPLPKAYFCGETVAGRDSTASHGQVEHLDEVRRPLTFLDKNW